jgi:hypothetical protein
MFSTHDWFSQSIPKLDPPFGQVSLEYAAKERAIGAATKLVDSGASERIRRKWGR